MARVSEIEKPGGDPVLTQIFEQERGYSATCSTLPR